MEPDEAEYCLGITERLMARPCGAPFVRAADDTAPGFEHYYTKIRRPMDLGQIKAKLLTNEYGSAAEWERDLKLVWQNAERFFGPHSGYTHLAHGLRDYFGRLAAERAPQRTARAWCACLRELHARLQARIHRCPASLAEHSPTGVTVRPLPKMSKREIARLIAASAQLDSRADAQEMFRIILRYEPETPILSKNLLIDIDTLPLAVVWSLERFVRRRFAELGRPYPEP